MVHPSGAQRWLLMAACVMVVIAGLRSAQVILVPVVLALFLAVLSAGPVAWLERRGLPTALAVALAVLTNVAVVVAVAFFLASSVNEFTHMIPRYQRRLEGTLAEYSVRLQAAGVRGAPETLGQFFDPGALFGMLTGTLRGLMSVLSNVLLVVITLMFVLLEVSGFPAKLRAAFEDPGDALSRAARIARDVHHYLWIKTLISLATGVCIGLFVHWMDVDLPVLWGLVAFFLNFIPSIGSILAAVPAVALSLMQAGFGRAAAVAGGYLAINVVLGNIIDPQLMGRRLGLSPLVVFLSVLFWGWLWGPVGMLLAVPLTMCVKIVLENTDDFRWAAVLLDSGRSLRAASAAVPAAEAASVPAPNERG